MPLLGHRLVEFAFRLPGRLKMPGLRLKQFLRQAMRVDLPPEVLRRPKRGFSVPMRLRFDRLYIRRMSLRFDLWLLLQGFRVVFWLSWGRHTRKRAVRRAV